MYSGAGIEKSDSFSHQLSGGRNSSTHTRRSHAGATADIRNPA